MYNTIVLYPKHRSINFTTSQRVFNYEAKQFDINYYLINNTFEIVYFTQIRFV